ncbi:polyribonucleotide nucleotidyltransferase [Candidatus Tachikawaea gelatinosa]|uniref:Polyribonucleotide nucleotidyltransferase n=1 Tax=Candidatus Tachikawaea gelatinosa TaxID=1410383 RepID=A0A090AJ21_9ENTR|nr:polyribonucleotide nucleotidyltransferase [Candidatus Tachikawaea gelatinosa]BAP58433.1 polyribonucleotide nucleotidyltransferase [Candidatus Tachikawaea gelatinosa]
MLNPTISTFKYGQHTIKLETGVIARQATAAVMTSIDDTSVLVTVVCQKNINSDVDFFPLTITYQERTYAAGRIPGSFFRREGRPSETEILVSRLIDRPLRPLFPEDFINEVQIIATVVSLNPQINPDIVAIIGASAALSLSGIPFAGPIGAARIGYINKEYVLNPTIDQMKTSDLDLVISSTKDAILMVESSANLLTEETILNAIIYGYEKQQKVIKNINKFVEKAGKKVWDWSPEHISKTLKTTIKDLVEKNLKKAYKIKEKNKRCERINEIKNHILETVLKEDDQLEKNKIIRFLLNIEREIMRKSLIKGNKRIDGRSKNEIRDINVITGILSRTHGSALFTRGETQALVTTTLGTSRDAQNVDELIGERAENFLFHYNFPPYSVGETGNIGSPKRREIGHGKLAKRSLLAVMPTIESFPYTIRLVSEITESNGSSSMASVCGASLALMDAGVPIKTAIAGIAMGLVKEKEDFVVLSDILGDEDHLGDMDFKVAGGDSGVTALQMDIKIKGITREIMKIALTEAKKARIHILNIMNKEISNPRQEISEFAPRIYTIKINTDKIKDVIGKGGSIIRSITEETKTTIEIEDDGTIKIAANQDITAKEAIRRIEEITAEIIVGNIYSGKVTRIVDFGAFVAIKGGKEGLVHISQITHKRVEKVTDFLERGQKVLVKVIEVDRNSRIRLSIKELQKT